MIVAHIIGNLLFILFLLINMAKIKHNIGKVAIISILLGCIIYVIYLTMLVMNFKVSGFDTQSLSMLILSWAFVNSAYCITKKKKV